ncbi:MAG: hypothetical protein OHK0038_21690 [Flammeovirgaceae bacterium]
MGFNWQDEWERHANEEEEKLQTENLADLLADVEAGWFGSYYNIWYTIAKKSTAHQAVPTLLKAAQQLVLHQENDELHLIHCLTAICKLLKIPEKQQKDYIYATDKIQAIQELQHIFEKLPPSNS